MTTELPTTQICAPKFQVAKFNLYVLIGEAKKDFDQDD